MTSHVQYVQIDMQGSDFNYFLEIDFLAVFEMYVCLSLNQ